MEKIQSLVNQIQELNKDKQIILVVFHDGSGRVCPMSDSKIGFSLVGFNNLKEAEGKLQTYIDKMSVPKVKLTNNYTAEVRPEGIVVGCQTISYETFEELAKVVKTNKSKRNSRIGKKVPFNQVKVGEFVEWSRGTCYERVSTIKAKKAESGEDRTLKQYNGNDAYCNADVDTIVTIVGKPKNWYR